MENRKKIYFIAGARPQFIKLAPVLAAMKKHPVNVEFIHTGQHYDYTLSDIFFDELNIELPSINLGCGSGTAHDQYAAIITALGRLLEREKPAAVVVVGDTHSTGAAAVCAALHRVPLIHIEAGLREWDKTIPEEVNKMITDTLSDLMLCPTPTAMQNLAMSGVRGQYFLTGDPGLDLVHYWSSNRHLSNIEGRMTIPETYILATSHREVHTRDREALEKILQIVTQMEYPVIWPMHPRTRHAVEKFQLTTYLMHPQLIVIDPVGFWDTQWLISHSKYVMTDSGGLIKEAYFHKKYVIILDHQTEWVEVVQEGGGIVCGPDMVAIQQAVQRIPDRLDTGHSLGDGEAAQKIAQHIVDFVHLQEG